jgi:hypothetical protein
MSKTDDKARRLILPRGTSPPRHQDGQQVSTRLEGAGKYFQLSRNPLAKYSRSEYIACVTQYYALELILITHRPQFTMDQHQCGITTKEIKEATGEQKKQNIQIVNILLGYPNIESSQPTVSTPTSQAKLNKSKIFYKMIATCLRRRCTQ